MDNVHHRPIKKFSLDGSIHDDSAFSRLKDQYITLLTTEMRLSGYVPRLDINPDFTLEYLLDKEYYHFELSMYGVYLGKKQAQWIDGVDETRIVITQKSKSIVPS